ncbi:hypothetical protein K7432_005315 [Basidiobolus ranarum]|uniref:Uncharacterized protein n=1 Tax=Basidiobolus ranarum TaxID=34480 RepID=A0ABR2W396_9FUNG
MSEAVESHGIFQFVRTEEEIVSELSGEIPPEEEKYYPKQDTHGWFHQVETPFEQLMEEKHGPLQVKSAVDLFYLQGKYEEALELALKYVNYVIDNKGITKLRNTKEMDETIVRCALRLEKLEIAEKHADKLATNEPGHMYLRGQVYTRVERYKDALNIFTRYLKIRKADYNIWKWIGIALGRWADTLTQPMEGKKLALACLLKSKATMTLSMWREHHFTQKRFKKELDEISSLIQSLECEGIQCDLKTIDLESLKCLESEIGVETLEFLSRNIKVVDKIVTEEKSVRDL